MVVFFFKRRFCRVVMESEKKEVESHKKLHCLDGDPDLLYSLLNKTKDFLTKKKAKELNRYTVNLDTNLRKSIALKRSRLVRAKVDNSRENEYDETIDVFNPNKFTAVEENDESLPATVCNEAIEKTGFKKRCLSQIDYLWNGKPTKSPMVIHIAEKVEVPYPAGEIIRRRKAFRKSASN